MRRRVEHTASRPARKVGALTPSITPFEERTQPLPRTFPLTILARDPGVLDRRRTVDPARRILRTVVDVPASRLASGPRGPRFHVIDFDPGRKGRRLHRALDLAPGARPAKGWGFVDPYRDADDETVLNDPGFRAQNVYAIAARTLDAFESALGRPVPWGFGNPQLYLVPTAFCEANAYYADDDQALYFGYFRSVDGDTTVLTCLAHDIVAHETTHAVLDGLRSRFLAPGLPDQAGFHEGFADIVALLSILSAKETTAQLLGDPAARRIPKEAVSSDALRQSVLLTIGQQFGDALHINRGDGLRRSVQLPPTKEWLDPANREWQEPHRRGEVLVAAVMQSLVGMWTRRMEPLMSADDTVDRARAAEEGANAARHLLLMAIRAIDYCPSVEFEFDDFATALMTSDTQVSPDDEFDYRGALKDGFGAFGIEAKIAPPVPLESKSERPTYRNFSYAALRSDPSEAFRFLWENAEFLGIASPYYVHVENVKPSVRVGPRGFVVSETVVDYVEELILTREELDRLARKDAPSFQSPPDLPSDTQLKIWGGGTVIFDEFGGLKFHMHKPISDWDRQRRRLEYLVRQGMWDTRGRLGFSTGASLGQRFAEFHQPVSNLQEQW